MMDLQTYLLLRHPERHPLRLPTRQPAQPEHLPDGHIPRLAKRCHLFLFRQYRSLNTVEQLAAADLQTTISGVASSQLQRPPLAPSSSLSSPDVLAPPITSGPSKPAPARAMQLGANKVPASALAAAVLAEEEAKANLPGGWGTAGDDLMDVHADEGDWTEFSAGDKLASSGLGFEEPVVAAAQGKLIPVSS
jgi:hypothetical protein